MGEKLSAINKIYSVIKRNSDWNENYSGTIVELAPVIADAVNSFDEIDLEESLFHLYIDDRSNCPVEKDGELLTIETAKEIIRSFFCEIDPNLKKKVDYILDGNMIKESATPMRAVTNRSGIHIYFNGSLGSLVALVHEVSHVIGFLDDNNNERANITQWGLYEVESKLTEQIFMQYISHAGLMIRTKTGNRDRISKIDRISMLLRDYKGSLETVRRAMMELDIRNLNGKEIDDDFIDYFCKKYRINQEEAYKFIQMTLLHYYADSNSPQNYVINNGEHLSNEMKFVYARCAMVAIGKKLDQSGYEYCKELYRKLLIKGTSISFEKLNEMVFGQQNPTYEDMAQLYVEGMKQLVIKRINQQH